MYAYTSISVTLDYIWVHIFIYVDINVKFFPNFVIKNQDQPLPRHLLLKGREPGS